MRSLVKRQYRTVTAVEAKSAFPSVRRYRRVPGAERLRQDNQTEVSGRAAHSYLGQLRVLGFTPSRRETDFPRQLGFVMGWRWHLHADQAVMGSFELHRIVYDLASASSRASRDELRQTWAGLSYGPWPSCCTLAAHRGHKTLNPARWPRRRFSQNRSRHTHRCAENLANRGLGVKTAVLRICRAALCR